MKNLILQVTVMTLSNDIASRPPSDKVESSSNSDLPDGDAFLVE
jgi:hypothetical protein